MAAAAARRPPPLAPFPRAVPATPLPGVPRCGRGAVLARRVPGGRGAGPRSPYGNAGEPPGPARFGSPGGTIEWSPRGACGGRWVWEGFGWPSIHGGGSCLYSLLIHWGRLPAAWVGERYRGLSPPLSPPTGEGNGTSQRLPFFQRSGGEALPKWRLVAV